MRAQQRSTSSQAITPLRGCCHRQLYCPYLATASGSVVLPYRALKRSAYARALSLSAKNFSAPQGPQHSGQQPSSVGRHPSEQPVSCRVPWCSCRLFSAWHSSHHTASSFDVGMRADVSTVQYLP